ncbi:MAG: hypothetical protein AB7I30_08385 [Isosphaeraceae bacterium]
MAGDIDILCPTCGASGHVPASYAGKEVRCKKCQGHFKIPIPQAGGPSAPPMASGRTLGDSVELAPLPPEEAAHAQERFMARQFGENRFEKPKSEEEEKRKGRL